MTHRPQRAQARYSHTICGRILIPVIGIWLLMSGALSAQPTGYIVDVQSGQDLEHTNNTKLWYAHGFWWAIAQDLSVDDWFLYKNDGPVPTTEGTQGGWTRMPVNIDNRNSTRIDLWYNATEDVVHVLRMHSSGGTYNEYTWNAGPERYKLDESLGDVSLPNATREASPSLAVDTTGQAFVVHDTAGVVTLEYSTDPARSLWSSIDIVAGGAPASDLNRASLAPFSEAVNGPQMGLLYYAAGGVLTFSWHDDDAGDTVTDWSSETVDVAMQADDHVCLRANGQTGDLHAVVRTDANDVNYYRRPAGGSWSAATVLSGPGVDATRPQVVVEEDNNEVYVFWTNWETDTIYYSRSPADTSDFSTPVEIIGGDNLGNFNDVQLPKHGVTCATGVMALASVAGQTWYNPVPVRWYRDLDGDLHGDSADAVAACAPPVGYVRRWGDCDETDPAINPGATELCDGIDNNCSGVIDDGGTTWYRDADFDGYGDPTDFEVACTQPIGFVVNSTDCDDSDATISPVGTEMCDGVDNDCDGMVDEEDGMPAHVPWYRDADGDGYGDMADSILACAQPLGYVLNSDDCDDTDPLTNPDAIELPDGVDNNCDGTVDNLPQATGYILDQESGQDLAHTNNSKLWYAHGRWWAIAQDTSADDWFMYESDGSLPATRGTEGGWTQLPVNVDNRNSARIDLWYNETEDVLHVLRLHSSGGTYNEYVWDVMLDRYVLDAVLGDVVLADATSGANPSISVDSTGQAFIARDTGGVVTLDYTTDAARSLWSSVTLATGAPVGGSTRASLMPFNDPVNGGQMGLLYFSANNMLGFLMHDDDLGDAALDWTAETVDGNTVADDHVCLRSHSQTGDLFAVVRTDPGAVNYYRRPAGGSWSAKTTIESGVLVATRPQLAVDEQNDEVYVFWTDLVDNRIVYRRASIDTATFEPVVEVIGHVGITNMNDVQTPKLGADAESGLMVLADGQGATWYNWLDIGSVVLRFTDNDTIFLDSPLQPDFWNIYRGDLAVLKQTGVYTQAIGSNPRAAAFCQLPTRGVTDTDTPPAGQADFYLATFVFGPDESGVGRDSDGVERPHDNPCP